MSPHVERAAILARMEKALRGLTDEQLCHPDARVESYRLAKIKRSEWAGYLSDFDAAALNNERLLRAAMARA